MSGLKEFKRTKPPDSGPAAQRRNRPSTRLVAYRGYLLTRGAVGRAPGVPPEPVADKDGRERWY